MISLKVVLSQQKGFSGWGAGKGKGRFGALAVLLLSTTTLALGCCGFFSLDKDNVIAGNMCMET